MTIREIRNVVFDASVTAKEIATALSTMSEDEKASMPKDAAELLDRGRFHIEQLISMIDHIEI